MANIALNMKNKLMICFSLVLLGFGTMSFASAGWVTFKFKLSSVLVPGAMKREVKKIDSALGKIKMTIFMHQSDDAISTGTLLYMFAHTTYPKDKINIETNPDPDFRESLYDGAVKGAAQEINGQVLKQNAIQVGKHAGREAFIQYESMILHNVIVIVANEMYMYQTISTEEASKGENEKRFFNSIQIN